MIDVRNYMEMVFSCVSVDSILAYGRCSYSCRIWSVDICVVPLAPMVTIIMGGTFHPLLRISLRSQRYFIVFCYFLLFFSNAH